MDPASEPARAAVYATFTVVKTMETGGRFMAALGARDGEWACCAEGTAGAEAVDAPEGLKNLLAARRGHFRYESGHHGALWLDLDPLFTHPARLRPLVRELGERLAPHRLDAVSGPANGGALLAYAIAETLDVAFYPAERHVLAGRVAYRLPASLRKRVEGARLAVVDDVMNAASAVRATLVDLQALGARCVALGALLTLGDAPKAFAAEKGLPLEALAALPHEIWKAAACPLCQAGEPLT